MFEKMNRETVREAALALRNKAMVGAMLAVPVAVNAQSVDPFQTVVDDLTSKVNGYGLGLAIFAGIGVGFGVAVKYIKKIKGAG